MIIMNNRHIKRIGIIMTLCFCVFTFWGCSFQDKTVVKEDTTQDQVDEIEKDIVDTKVQDEEIEMSIIEGNNSEGNISVESEAIQNFLEGKGVATLSESFFSICSEIELNYLYEGTIGDIVEGYYEDFAKYLNNQQLSDLKVNAKDFESTNGGEFTYVLIDGELNQSNDLFLILKESDNQIKICFEGQNSEHTEFYFRDCGRIDELANGYDKHYANYYYLNKTGDVFELFEWSEYVLELQDDEKQFLGVENTDNFDEVYIEEYTFNDKEYYTIGFGNAINEANQDKILEYLIESNFVENKIYLAEDEIWEKIYEMIYSLEIDPNVILDLTDDINELEIKSAEVIDAENYVIKCMSDDKEYILKLEGYEDSFIPYTLHNEIMDVTGDGKKDLIVNVKLNGNNLCENLSETYVYVAGADGLEEILYIAYDGISIWDEKYQYNIGCHVAEEGGLAVDVCSASLEAENTIILEYIEGVWHYEGK